MPTKRDAVPARPYPYTVDRTERGRWAKVPGRQGKFLVMQHETNPTTGAAWWSLVGPWTAGDHGQFTNVREIVLLPEKKEPRYDALPS